MTCWLAIPADHSSLLLLFCREVKAALATAAAITSAEGGRTPLHLVVMGHVDAGGRWQQEEQPVLQVWNSSCKLGSGSSDSNCAWEEAVTSQWRVGHCCGSLSLCAGRWLHACVLA